MEQEILDRAATICNFIETSDGKVTFTMNPEPGNLVALLIDELGEFTLLQMDRSQDKSNELYLDVLKRWITSVGVNKLSIVDVGELIFDKIDDIITYIYIDDNLLGYITTYPLPDDDLSMVPIYTHANPDWRWYLHVAHQALTNGNQYNHGVTLPLAWAFLSAREAEHPTNNA